MPYILIIFPFPQLLQDPPPTHPISCSFSPNKIRKKLKPIKKQKQQQYSMGKGEGLALLYKLQGISQVLSHAWYIGISCWIAEISFLGKVLAKPKTLPVTLAKPRTLPIYHRCKLWENALSGVYEALEFMISIL